MPHIVHDRARSKYDEISPITGNYSVLVENIDLGGNQPFLYKICMQSGYHTYPEFWNDSRPDVIEDADKRLPGYIVELKHRTSEGIIWYPICIIDGISLLLIKDPEGNNCWGVFNTIQTEGAHDKVGDSIYIKDEPLKTFTMMDFESAWEYYYSLNDLTVDE